MLNWDVASLYPLLMINEGYVSRSVSNPKEFEKVVETRLDAKRRKDKPTANALKLVINSSYGAMLNKYNPMYDPLMARSVCISGQLYLTDLVVGLMQKCSTFETINFNTDGIMFAIDDSELQAAYDVKNEWENRTRLVLEEDRIIKIYMKDVNNYICKFEDGTVKAKGGFVSLFKGGDFKMNSLSIIHKAVADYLMDGVPVETTIGECEDIFAFQNIVKTGGSFEGSFHRVDGELVPIQKVNRVYAVRNPKYGEIVKGKWITEKRKKDKETGKMISIPVDPPQWSESTIPECPEHTFIDNENVLTVDDLDKDYYIDMAKRRIDKYINIDPKVKRKIEKITQEVVIMAEKTETAQYEKMNVYQKLGVAREQFYDMNVKKTGINRYAGFKYYSLEDIVPVKNVLLNRLGLVDPITFNGKESATLTLINVHNPEEKIEFSTPLENDESLISNPIQKLGAIETYIRRYLYLMMLDIVEGDAIDETSGKPVDDTGKPAPAAKKSNRPATPEQREEIKNELIDKDGAATDTQIKSIKNGLKKLRTKDESFEEYVTATVVKLKAGITKTEAENLLIEIGEKIAE